MKHQRRVFAPATILRDPVHALAFGLGTGLSPQAPGTVGTTLGLPLLWLLKDLSLISFVAVLVVLLLLGVWITANSSRRLGVHDHGGIVLDEIVAYPMAASPLLPDLGLWSAPMWLGMLCAFVLFRFFDIVKPWPIRWVDRRVGGGWGIMLDDVIAALFSALVLAVIASWI